MDQTLDHTGDADRTACVPFEIKSLGTLTKDDGSETGVFEGMASTFGNVDLDGDIIAPGAFKGAKAAKVKMLWQHDSRQPIGVWETLEETDKGLRVKGQLILEVQQAAEAFALLKGGAIDSLSIGFRVPPNGSVFDEAQGKRLITKINLWEVSIVSFPSNPKARISRVKSIKTIRDFETFLRDEGGYSHAAARSISRDGFKPSTEPRDEDGLDELVASIKRTVAILQS